MKMLIVLLCITLIAINANAQTSSGSDEQLKSLALATQAIWDAFARGDAAQVAELHAPNVEKYFGGNNVILGRAALQKELAEWFKTAKVEVLVKKIESTVFAGQTAIQTFIFSIKSTPKGGGKPEIINGRAMLVFMLDKTSPTGWLCLREMTQEAPDNK
jgi:ketosteroid isomerase-like protein